MQRVIALDAYLRVGRSRLLSVNGIGAWVMPGTTRTDAPGNPPYPVYFSSARASFLKYGCGDSE